MLAGGAIASRPVRADVSDFEKERALETVNKIRASVGLTPVELSESLCQGAEAHALYLSLNQDDPSTANLGAHQETPGRPGFSEAGRQAGTHGDIAFGVRPVESIAIWIDSYFHRLPFLDPEADAVGIGVNTVKDDVPVSILSFHMRPRGAGRGPVLLYPFEGMRNVPLSMPLTEIPSPIPEGGDDGRSQDPAMELDEDPMVGHLGRSREVGYPITLQMRPGHRLTEATGSLTVVDGAPVPVYFDSPETPPSQIAARYIGSTLALIPHDPLQMGTRYRAWFRCRVDGGAPETWTATFRTEGEDLPSAGEPDR
jgi:hypothetical protein